MAWQGPTLWHVSAGPHNSQLVQRGGRLETLKTLCRPRFTVQVALFSRRPRVGGLTVVTSGADNRLAMLDGMCATWVGPLAVAILLPVLARPDAAQPGGSAGGQLEGTKRCPP